MPSSSQQIKKVFQNIEKAINDAVKAKELRPLAEYAIDLIVKRTRLGYGVNRQFGSKVKLKKLSERYIEQRERSRLSGLTRPGTSNLTFTGQLLDSLRIISQSGSSIKIGPQGRRKDGLGNDEVAAYQEEQGRIFNRVSKLEYQQLLRFYRRTFGDLLKRKKLLA